MEPQPKPPLSVNWTPKGQDDQQPQPDSHGSDNQPYHNYQPMPTYTLKESLAAVHICVYGVRALHTAGSVIKRDIDQQCQVPYPAIANRTRLLSF